MRDMIKYESVIRDRKKGPVRACYVKESEEKG